jgi:hypothetical protein
MITFAPDTQFFDYEGFPVTIGAGPDATPSMYCAAWDVAPPRHFDPDSCRRNAAPITREAFLRMLRDTPHQAMVSASGS